MWSLSLITAPAKEPLELGYELKAHLRLDGSLEAQETLLDGHVATARADCENFTGRQLITATWELWLSHWCEPALYLNGALRIPKPPLQGVTSIKYLDGNNVLQTWAPDQYIVVAPAGPTAQPGYIVPAYGVERPPLCQHPQAIRIRFDAGYGADRQAVPAGLRQGMLLRVGELYERREEQTIGTIVSPNSLKAEGPWWPFRTF